jgi:hypothetical protein
MFVEKKTILSFAQRPKDLVEFKEILSMLKVEEMSSLCVLR